MYQCVLTQYLHNIVDNLSIAANDAALDDVTRYIAEEYIKANIALIQSFEQYGYQWRWWSHDTIWERIVPLLTKLHQQKTYTTNRRLRLLISWSLSQYYQLDHQLSQVPN